MTKLIRLALFCFFSWFCACGAFAANSITVQSLNAAGAITTGTGFAGKISGAIQSATIFLTGNPTSLSYQVQVLDPVSNTWVPTSAAVAITALPANQTIVVTGPFADIRVSITAFTSGTLTANIQALY